MKRIQTLHAQTKNEQGAKELFGYALSVALRKSCDSSPTTITYIAHHNLGDGEWERYVDFLWEHEAIKRLFEKKRFSIEAISRAVKRASLDYDRNIHRMDPSKMATIMALSFKTWRMTDWRAYTAFLWEKDNTQA